MLIAGRGVAQVMSNGQLIPFSNPAFESLGKGHVGPVPVQVLVDGGLCRRGDVCHASYKLRPLRGGDRRQRGGGAAGGRQVNRTKVMVYALSGGLAGVAGLIETARLAASDAARVGLNIELDAIAAVVVGGTPLTGGRATIAGTLVGALVMQVITTSFNMLLIPFSWSLVLKAVIILVAVYIQRPRLA
jgi:ribose/xylose/arabinose/galactoside ABC-type transport system permease subunit